MRIEQLHYFLRILEVGSFRQAAEELHVSQPTLSESLKGLERELGAQLMERGRGGIRLTAVGQEALPHIRAVVESESALRSEVDAHRGLHRGQIRIGSTNAGASTILPAVLRSLHARYPDVQLQVTEAGSLHIQQQVKDGDFDIGLVVGRGHPESSHALLSQTLLVSRLVVCVPGDHRLADATTLTVDEIAEEPLILYRSGYFMHDLAFELFESRDLNVVFFTDNTESVKRMIASGIGITVLPEFSVYPDLLAGAGDIRYVPLATSFDVLTLQVIRRRSSYASRAVREVWSDLVVEAAAVNDHLARLRAGNAR